MTLECALMMRITVLSWLVLSLIGTAIFLGVSPDQPIQAFCIDYNWGEGGSNGFGKPNSDSLPQPIQKYLGQSIGSFQGNERNIAALARSFTKRSFDYVSPEQTKQLWSDLALKTVGNIGFGR